MSFYHEIASCICGAALPGDELPWMGSHQRYAPVESPEGPPFECNGTRYCVGAAAGSQLICDPSDAPLCASYGPTRSQQDSATV
eukprot:205332-Amphidinium_carterae.1